MDVSRWSGALGGAALAFSSASLMAQADYPTRPVRFLVGAAPGGATEILARALGNKLAEKYGQQVLIDPRPGANHIIAGELTAQAAPDGYTIQMIPEGWVINASVYPKLPFDPVAGFSAIAMVAMVPNILVVHPSLPVKSVPEFIALARRRPGELAYGTSGVGSPSHMSAELFKILAKVDYVHIPYKGNSLTMIDLIGGQLQFSFPSVPTSLPFIKAGRVRALGVTTPQRSSALPEIPTIQEAGLPRFEVNGWYGVIGPRGMPRGLVERINHDINAALQSPDLAKLLSGRGADPVTRSADDFARAMTSDRQKWADVVRTAGIKVQR
jgi:tripartite-type tricarboxylate transporter receptor subunit TctC